MNRPCPQSIQHIEGLPVDSRQVGKQFQQQTKQNCPGSSSDEMDPSARPTLATHRPHYRDIHTFNDFIYNKKKQDEKKKKQQTTKTGIGFNFHLFACCSGWLVDRTLGRESARLVASPAALDLHDVSHARHGLGVLVVELDSRDEPSVHDYAAQGREAQGVWQGAHPLDILAV